MCRGTERGEEELVVNVAFMGRGRSMPIGSYPIIVKGRGAYTVDTLIGRRMFGRCEDVLWLADAFLHPHEGHIGDKYHKPTFRNMNMFVVRDGNH